MKGLDLPNISNKIDRIFYIDTENYENTFKGLDFFRHFIQHISYKYVYIRDRISKVCTYASTQINPDLGIWHTDGGCI